MSRKISYAIVIRDFTCPLPSQYVQGSFIMRVTDSRTRLRVISTRPSSEILRTFVFALSLPSASCKALKTFSRFWGLSMSMKSMMMMPPMLRSRSW